MQTRIIEYFTINKLFGIYDVHIPFETNIKILIGENGLGKTQALNIFYYTLTKNFQKLNEFEFSEIKIKFNTSKEVVISKKEISYLVESSYKSPLLKDVINVIGIKEFENLRFLLLHSSRSSLEDDPAYQKIKRMFPARMMDRLYEELLFNKESDEVDIFTASINSAKEKISENIKGKQILYFPTFRRVEEDLRNLGYDESQFKLSKEDNRLIHFGMEDVKKRFINIENTIDRLLKEGFAKISTEILSQLVKGFSETDINVLKRIAPKDIEIILARVGDQIPEADKESIRQIVLGKTIERDDKNLSLLYFLQKLIDIYEQQREWDNSIKIFREVCNKYLINKKVVYDESAIKIFIRSEFSPNELLLSKLSSGEKQIISIFSKIYLSNEDSRFILLFDEPELSLSMLWQKQLLTDILDSGKCDFLLAVTHSPFVFSNELDDYAIGLDQYFKPTTNRLLN